MTNTLNTPVEALEFAYPLRILRYSIRAGSGGRGQFTGGDGVLREIQVLTSAEATLLSDRRRFAPYGLADGEPGQPGENWLLRGEQSIRLPGKGRVELEAGDILRICTPGGGGYGAPGD
jgi:N-methylhydantoinase B